MSYFHKDFLVGAATAAHQVEGNNTNSDFWVMEQIPNSIFEEPSGICVDHYNRYREDIDLLAAAGLNAYRFSIEWARIQPDKNTFDTKEIDHYRDMLEYCREIGVTPIVTMHHFSSPKWLIQEGGWEAESTADYFARYCGQMVRELGDILEYVCTVNEANMGLQIAKIAARHMAVMGGTGDSANNLQVGLNDQAAKSGGTMEAIMSRMKAVGEAFGMDPRNIQDFLKPRTAEGDRIIMTAHEKARDAMKAVCPRLKIGVTFSLQDNQALPGGEQYAETEWNDGLLHYLPYLTKDDFIGVQTYTRSVFGPNGMVPPAKDAELTLYNYEFYPEALENVIRFVGKHTALPIIVTENGCGIADDARRIEFLRRALAGVKRCIDDGLPVKGYCCWSLLDNFEWQKGFAIPFGLIAVDRATQKRTPKPSLAFLGSYADPAGQHVEPQEASRAREPQL
ncbi:MAG: family 1 glycosylhydrolase [Treponema sp.]|jgi:beta-glucosidase|nr:family 1 glycosylhydrolase [Treponema sp.]